MKLAPDRRAVSHPRLWVYITDLMWVYLQRRVIIAALSVRTAVIIFALVLALELRAVHRAHVRRQIAPLAERSSAVGARVIPALLVHHAHVNRQVARLPERSGAVGARVVLALLVHSAYVLRHVARLAERSGAMGARVVPALLVHRLDVLR